MPGTHNASDEATLKTALNIAQPGDEIICASGDWGGFNVDNYDFSNVNGEYVTMRAADLNDRPQWNFTRIRNVHNLAFDGIFFGGGSFGNGNSTVNVDGATNLIIRNSKANGRDTAWNIKNVDGLLFENNEVDETGEDAFVFLSITNFQILNNGGRTQYFPQPDDHADFLQFKGSSSHGVVRGNVCFPDYFGGKILQGVFLGNGTYDDISFEDNLIYCTAGNGLGDHEGQTSTSTNMRLLRNTVLNVPNQNATRRNSETVHNETFIGINGVIESEGNIANAGGAQLFAQHLDTAQPNHYSFLYENAMAGMGAIIEDWRPIPGGPADFGTGMGAERRIAELLNSGGPTPMSDFLTIVPGSITLDDPTAGAYTIVDRGTPPIVDEKIHFVPAAGFSGPAGGTYEAVDQAGQATGPVRFDFNVTDPPPQGTADTFPDVPNNHLGIDLDVLQNDLADTPAS